MSRQMDLFGVLPTVTKDYITQAEPVLLDEDTDGARQAVEEGKSYFAYWGWLVCGRLFTGCFIVPHPIPKDDFERLENRQKALNCRASLLEYVQKHFGEAPAKDAPAGEGVAEIADGGTLPSPAKERSERSE